MRLQGLGRFGRAAIVALAATGSAALAVRTGRAEDPQNPGLPLPSSIAKSTTPAAASAPPAGTAAPLASAPTSVDVTGRYRVRGRHDARGSFAGTLQILATASGLRYERKTRYDTVGPQVVDRGVAIVTTNGLETDEDAPTGTTGLAAAATTSASATAHPLRRTSYRRLQKDVYEGTFCVDQGSTSDSGVERIDRGDVAEDSFELLVDGPEAFPAFRRDIAAAQKSINVQTYIWKGDDTGRSMGSLIASKARSGIEVRVLVDSIGVEKGGDKVLDEMRAAGAKVIVENQWYKGLGNSLLDIGRSIWNGIKSLFGGGPAQPREKRGIFNHAHRKVLIVDGKSGFTGGMNMADEYEKTWHDVHCRVQGPVVDALQDHWLDRWRAAGGEPPRDRSLLYHDRSLEAPAGDVKLKVLVTTPGLAQEIRSAYVYEIARARSRILIENAYFLDDEVVGILQRKAREVPVTVIIPADEFNDVSVVKDAFNYIQNDVVRSGIDLRKYRGRMVHSKVAAIDGLWATVGSANLDTLGLNKLTELNVATVDPRVAETLDRRIFAIDIPGSEKVVEKKLSWWQKLKSGVLHFFSGFM